MHDAMGAGAEKQQTNLHQISPNPSPHDGWREKLFHPNLDGLIHSALFPALREKLITLNYLIRSIAQCI
jgi:hypothetical protein